MYASKHAAVICGHRLCRPCSLARLLPDRFSTNNAVERSGPVLFVDHTANPENISEATSKPWELGLRVTLAKPSTRLGGLARSQPHSPHIHCLSPNISSSQASEAT